MSAADHRTVGELLADSDKLARETLLDATPDHAPAMVRSWNQLVGPAAELWAVLHSAPDNPSGLDPMERLRAHNPLAALSDSAIVRRFGAPAEPFLFGGGDRTPINHESSSRVGEAIGRSVTAGHWPGQGPTEEHLTQIADNLSRARHLIEPHGPSQQAPLETQRDIQDLHGQVMHRPVNTRPQGMLRQRRARKLDADQRNDV